MWIAQKALFEESFMSVAETVQDELQYLKG